MYREILTLDLPTDCATIEWQEETVNDLKSWLENVVGSLHGMKLSLRGEGGSMSQKVAGLTESYGMSQAGSNDAQRSMFRPETVFERTRRKEILGGNMHLYVFEGVRGRKTSIRGQRGLWIGQPKKKSISTKKGN